MEALLLQLCACIAGKDREQRMSMMQLPEAAPALVDTEFPKLEVTSTESYKVAFFSTAPYDQEPAYVSVLATVRLGEAAARR